MKTNWKQYHNLEFTWMDGIHNKLSKIHNIDNLKEFLKPSEHYINPTNKLMNIKPFVMRLVKAFKEGEHIVIIGDVDY